MAAVLERLRKDPGLTFVLIAIAAAIALYAPAIGRGLINYDDPMMIRDNWVVQDVSWASVRTIFFDLDSPRRFTLAPEYLPIRDLSVMLDFAVWGHNFAGFHLTNLVLYLAAIALWFKAFEAFGIERSLAGLAMLLWALHPTHAESVAWLSERKGLLGAVFSGTCALAYARFRAGSRAGWLALAMGAAVFAVWSKAIATFAVAGIGGLELALPAKRVGWKRSLVGLGAIGVVGALAFIPVLRLATQADVVGTDVVAPAGRFEMVFGVLGFYARLGAMTIKNALSYPIGTAGPSVVDVVLGVVVLAALGYAAVRATSRELRAAALLWLIAWFPVSHLVLPLQMVFVADRYLLIPTLGLALAAAVGLSKIRDVRSRRALIAVVGLAAGLRSLDAQSSWRDEVTLWDRAVASNPGDGMAWSLYAQALADAGDPDAADLAVEEGLTHTRSPRLLMRKAMFEIAHGRRAEGVALMRAAAEGNEPRAMSNLALLLEEDGKTEEALTWARRVANGVPNYLNGQRLYGKIALGAHHPDEALIGFQRAFELEPQNPANHYNLALALIALRRAPEARPHLLLCANDPTVGGACRAELARFQPSGSR